jgi:hypothetical protein
MLQETISPTPTALSSPLAKVYGVSIDVEALANYSRELQLKEPTEALLYLAEAIASSPSWADMPGYTLIVRATPQPALAVLGCFDQVAFVRIITELRSLNQNLRRLRFVKYDQAEQDCQCLAEKLVKRFGKEKLKQFHFTAIPRGGLIVLGMLAYALGLTPEQLQPPPSPDVPWVVVDDCVFTGSRLSHFLQSHSHQAVIFAHLYSHPDLRKAIATREQNVLACFSAHDVHDYAPEDLDDGYQDWQARSLRELEGSRYWVGKTEHVCFHWNEPDRFIWNPVTKTMEACWLLLPPQICQKNRLKAGENSPIIQVQPQTKAPLQTGLQVIYGMYKEQIVIGNLTTQESFYLTGVAADIWQAMMEYGDIEKVMTSLLGSYDVEEVTLRRDVETFVGDLYAQGLLVVCHTNFEG